MAKKREARSLLEVCVARGGYRKGPQVAQFIIEWTIAATDLGHQPTVTEFSYWWRGNERTAWRRLKVFKELFEPEGYDTPAPIAEHLIAEARKRKIGEGLNREYLMGERVLAI